jgi:hypothetical protein
VAEGQGGHEIDLYEEMSTDARIEQLLREMAPQVLGALVRRYGQFEECEDAVQ